MADFKLRAPPRVRFHGAVSFDGVFGAGGGIALTGDAIARAVGQAALLRGMNLAGAGVASSQATAALLKGVRLQSSATAGAAGSATLVSSLPASDIVSFTLLSAVGGSDVGFSIGHPFPQGAVPLLNYLSTSTAGVTALRADVKNRWPDGSVKFAILSGRANLTANTPKLISVTRAVSDPGGTAVTIADLKATGITASIAYGAYGTVTWDAATTDFDNPFQWSGGSTEASAAWLRNAACSSWLYRKPIGSDNHLVGWLEVRCYASGAVEVVPWIENGYLTVASPGERSGTATFTLGGSQRFNQSVTLRHHTRAVLCTGTAYSHWLGTDPQLSWKHNRSYFDASKMAPKYSASVPSGSSFWSSVVTTHQPGDTGGYRPGNQMPDTGYHASIGPLPAWEAAYTASYGDIRAWRSIQANCYIASNRYGLHYRDQTTNRPIRFSSYPTKTIQGVSNSGIKDCGTSSDVCPVNSGTVPDTWELAHSPSVGFMAYLLTGRFFFMEQTQFAATVAYLHAGDHVTLGRNLSQGLIRPDQSAWQNRGAAWGMRALAHAACVSPDDEPNLRTEFITSIQYNIDDWHNEYVVNTYSLLGLAKFSDTNITPWRDDWINVAFHWLYELKVYGNNQTKLEEFLTYKSKSIIGRLGGQGANQYCYKDAAIYDAPPSLVGAASWGDFYQAIFGTNTCDSGGTALRGTSGADPAEMATGYWGNLHPGIAYAVDFGAAGALTSWNRLTGASNYAASAETFNDNPVWGIAPRSITSALESAALSLAPGQCVRLTTPLDGNILKPDGAAANSILAYCGTSYWDVVRREVGFIGKSASASYHYYWLVYDVATNSWSNNRGLWSGGSSNQTGHGYDHTTYDPATGRVFHRHYNANVAHIWDGNSWTDTASMSGSYNIVGGLAWFPGVGLIYADGNSIKRWNGTSWSNLATYNDSSYHDIAEYNPTANVLLFGAGNTTPLRKLDSSLNITTVASPPFGIGAGTGLLVSDANTANAFAYNKASGTFQRFDIEANSWSAMTKSTGNGSAPQYGMPNVTAGSENDLTGCPIPEYGVTMWIQWLGSGSTLAGVWLYKHA